MVDSFTTRLMTKPGMITLPKRVRVKIMVQRAREGANEGKLVVVVGDGGGRASRSFARPRHPGLRVRACISPHGFAKEGQRFGIHLRESVNVFQSHLWPTCQTTFKKKEKES